MKLRLLQLYEAITNSFWFVPTLMAILAAAAALGSVELERRLGEDALSSLTLIWSGSASGARSVLSTVAGSVMTVVSIVFSITVTALAQMSSQYGPRILRNFTSDRGNQITLGTFIATFIYCLLVLRTIRSVEENTFVPDLSVTLGVAMAVASLAVLIYFIHHISQSIQAEYLIADAGREFQHVLPVVFPERIGHNEEEFEQPDEQDALYAGIDWATACEVTTHHHGYVQRIDDTQLLRVACEHDLVVRLEYRPGDFVMRYARLLQAWPGARVSEQAERQLRECYSFGPNRTPHQDVSYPLRQLVEIAVRALSPGINEPYTAMTCIDWLGSSLSRVAERKIPSPYRYDDNRMLRVVAQPLSFDELVAVAFNQIRLYAHDNANIMEHLLATIARLAPYLHREEDRQSLIRHVNLIGLEARQIANEVDRWRVEEQLRQTLHDLSPPNQGDNRDRDRSG